MIIWKCKFCEKELEQKDKYTKSGHLSKCKEFKKFKDCVLTKEYLFEEYITLNKSAIEIAKNNNLESATTVIKLLKQYDIETRDIKSSKNEREKNKRKQTNIHKYGVEHNFSKTHPSRVQWEKKMFEEFGITNIFQRIDIVDKITNKKFENGFIIPRNLKTDVLEKYYSDVWYYTNKNFNKFYNDINPENFKRGVNTYHLDHKVSILYGFLNGISPEIIAHKCNLEMLYYKDNLQKQANCSLTLEQLNFRIKEFENIKGKK